MYFACFASLAPNHTLCAAKNVDRFATNRAITGGPSEKRGGETKEYIHRIVSFSHATLPISRALSSILQFKF